MKTSPWAVLFIALCVNFGVAKSKPIGEEWIGSWATSPQIPEPHNALNPDDLNDATLRQIVHLSAGGTTLRVHISNAFGTMPMHFTAVHIARPLAPAEAKIDVATDKALTFSGKPDVTVPAGAEYISDPIAYPLTALSDLAITLHLDYTARTTNWASRLALHLVSSTWRPRLRRRLARS